MSSIGLYQKTHGAIPGDKGVAALAFFVGVIGILAWGGIRVVSSINFNRHCSGYLKNAADANTVEQAEKRLAIAMDYIEKHRLNKGFTSVLWTSPSEDVAFWAENLTSSLEELRSTGSEATSLEKSNVLMKLRETILDDTSEGQSVTKPAGIAVFPHNVGLAWLGGLFLVLAMFGGAVLFEQSGKFTFIECLVVLAILALSVMGGM